MLSSKLKPVIIFYLINNINIMGIKLKNLNKKQEDNLKENIKAYHEGSKVAAASPSVLYIELTQNCISRCEFCKPQWENNPKFDMNEEYFNILLKDYIPYSVLVDLRAWGESLMLPDFDVYLSKVAQFGPSIRLATTLGCGTKKVLNSLIDFDVFLSISIDAAEKKIYESIRRGVNFNTVLKNLDYIVKKRKEKMSRVEDIRFSVCLQKNNLDQMKKIEELALKYEIPEIRIVPLQSYPEDKKLLKYNEEKTVEVLKELVESSKYTGIKYQLGFCPFDALKIDEKIFDPCCHPWLYALITYNGDFYPCEHMLGNNSMNLKIGNIKDNKESLWNGDIMQKLRLAHSSMNYDILPKKCHKCYLLGRYADHEQDIYSEFNKWLVDERDIEMSLEKYK